MDDSALIAYLESQLTAARAQAREMQSRIENHRRACAAEVARLKGEIADLKAVNWLLVNDRETAGVVV